MSDKEITIKYLTDWFKKNSKNHPRKWARDEIGRLIKSELSKTNNFKCKSHGGHKAGYEKSKDKLINNQFKSKIIKSEIKPKIDTKEWNGFD